MWVESRSKTGGVLCSCMGVCFSQRLIHLIKLLCTILCHELSHSVTFHAHSRVQSRHFVRGTLVDETISHMVPHHSCQTDYGWLICWGTTMRGLLHLASHAVLIQKVALLLRALMSLNLFKCCNRNDAFLSHWPAVYFTRGQRDVVRVRASGHNTR